MTDISLLNKPNKIMCLYFVVYRKLEMNLFGLDILLFNVACTYVNYNIPSISNYDYMFQIRYPY